MSGRIEELEREQIIVEARAREIRIELGKLRPNVLDTTTNLDLARGYKRTPDLKTGIETLIKL